MDVVKVFCNVPILLLMCQTGSIDEIIERGARGAMCLLIRLSRSSIVRESGR